MLRPSLSKRMPLIGWILGLIIAMTGAACWRLSRGPVDAPYLRGVVASAFSTFAQGGAAKTGDIQIAWFPTANALGVKILDLRVVDAKGRQIFAAGEIDAAFAADGFWAATLAPGRLSVKDYRAVVSVSPQGDYGLGYAAAESVQGQTSLDRVFFDLIGRERAGHPISYLSELVLHNGRVSLRQIGAPLAWTANIGDISFIKRRKKIDANIGLTVDGSDLGTSLAVKANADLDLRRASVDGLINNLSPAKIFPSVGPTKALSALDSVINGHGALTYEAGKGFQSANVVFTSQAGSIRFGGIKQPFSAAKIEAGYDPVRKDVILHTLQFATTRARLDLIGRFHLNPEDRRKRTPAQIEYSVSGPKVAITLSQKGAIQELTDVVARGRYTPELRRLEIDEGRAKLVGAPATAQGVLWQDEQGQWGAQLKAHLEGGAVGTDQIFAFWPDGLGAPVRNWLQGGIKGGRYSNAQFSMNVPAGAFDGKVLSNDMLHLTFGIDQAEMRYAESLPPVTHIRGRGVLEGNRFALILDSGELNGLKLSKGKVDVPRLIPEPEKITITAHGVGPATSVLEIVDQPNPHLLTHANFAPSRVTGDAELDLTVVRLHSHSGPSSLHDFTFAYGGHVRNARVRNAAANWDLSAADASVAGDQNGLTVMGNAEVGPYRGSLIFRSAFKAAKSEVALDGAVDAPIFGGAPGRSSPLKAEFAFGGGLGQATIHASVFDGAARWEDRNGRTEHVVIDGRGYGRALKQLGAGLFAGAPEVFATRVDLLHSGSIWKGTVSSPQFISGDLAVLEGSAPRAVFQADITPQLAARLGLSEAPLFAKTRRLSVNSLINSQMGDAVVKVDTIAALITWNKATGVQRIESDLSAVQIHSLGAPAAINPKRPLHIAFSWKDTSAGLEGLVELPGAPLKLTMTSAGENRQWQVSGELNTAAVESLGLSDKFEIKGASAFSVGWTQTPGAIAGRLEMDLTAATLSAPHSDWSKAAGKSARFVIDFGKTETGDLILSRIFGEGDRFAIDGRGVFSPLGHLRNVTFSQIRLDGLIDAQLAASQDANNGPLRVAVTGRYIDARHIVDKLNQPAPGDSAPAEDVEAPPIALDVALDQLRLTDSGGLNAFRLSGLYGAPTVTRLSFSSTTRSGAKFSGRVEPTAQGLSVSAETLNAGDVMNAAFGLSDLRGGAGALHGWITPAGVNIVATIKDARLVKAPIFAQLLTVASLSGIADTLKGDGVRFDTVVIPFEIRGKTLDIKQAYATSSALGVTLNGQIDLSQGRLNLQGTLAPAYALNSAVGAIPFIGPLLISRQGEGLFGLGYWIRGDFDKPSIYANPLSLATPGALRQVFESQKPKP